MAERSRTGYLTRFPINVEKPKGAIPGVLEGEHQHRLWSLRAAYDLLVDAREQFARSKAEIDQRLSDGESGPKGHRDELKTLRDEYRAKLAGPPKTVEQVRQYGEKLLAAPQADQSDDRPMTRADFRAERARERAVERVWQLSPSDRREAIRVASQKQDYAYLRMLLDEPGLLDGQTAAAISNNIARNSNPDAFQRWQDLHGRVEPGATEPDGLTGALSVTAFVIDSTEKWIDEQAGIESTLAERLAGKATSNGGSES